MMKILQQPSHRQPLALLLLFLLLSCLTVVVEGQTRDDNDILWEESFDYGENDLFGSVVPKRIDDEYWNYEVGRGIDGWGNWELQNYTDGFSNVRVVNGNLEITAAAAVEESNNNDTTTTTYTSGRIQTKDKVLFKYGIVEASISIPDVVEGLWPAFWTSGYDIDTVGWPSSGEIDIMEMGSGSAIRDGLGNKQVTSGAHWGSGNSNDSNNNTGPVQVQAYASHPTYPYGDVAGGSSGHQYYTFKMDWTPTKITTYIVHDDPSVDDFMLWEMLIDEFNCPNCYDEFHKPHFLVLNLAVGGFYTTVPPTSDEDSSSSLLTKTNCNNTNATTVADNNNSNRDASIVAPISNSTSDGILDGAHGGCVVEEEENLFVARTDISAPLPATMKVDWVRIRQNGYAEVTFPKNDNNNNNTDTNPKVVVPSPTTPSPIAVPTPAPAVIVDNNNETLVPTTTYEPSSTTRPSNRPSARGSSITQREVTFGPTTIASTISNTGGSSTGKGSKSRKSGGSGKAGVGKASKSSKSSKGSGTNRGGPEDLLLLSSEYAFVSSSSPLSSRVVSFTTMSTSTIAVAAASILSFLL